VCVCVCVCVCVFVEEWKYDLFISDSELFMNTLVLSDYWQGGKHDGLGKNV